MLAAKPSPLVDTRVIYCGDNLEQLRKLPPGCIDLIYPITAMPERRIGEMDFMKDKVGRPDIDAFEAVMIPEERKLGYFVGFDFTGDALLEIDRFRRKEGREIKPLTIREILDEEIEEK